MEVPQRRILPLPKRRIVSSQLASSLPTEPTQPLIPSGAGLDSSNGLDDEVDAISKAFAIRQTANLLYSNLPQIDGQDLHTHMHRGDFGEDVADLLDGSEFDEEDDDDSCTGCRDWLENVKNKKKRKIPTSAVMGHTNSTSSPVSQVQSAISQSPSRLVKNKSRRRRTWDVSSESHPDSAFRNGRIAAAALSDPPRQKDSLFERDFEFTCESPVARNLPAPPPAPVEILPARPKSIATQTSPSLAAMDPILPLRHRRTKEERAYDRQRLVARQRQEARAKLKPGEKESVWICNFCEYESIFGYPPLALIYAYTKRIRDEKREALKRQRLLAKARSKGKKKKKGQLPPVGDLPPAHTDNKITPTHQNGGKTGIDKAIGPGSANCTCCDHRRDKEERDNRHRARNAQSVPAQYSDLQDGASQHDSDLDHIIASDDADAQANIVL